MPITSAVSLKRTQCLEADYSELAAAFVNLSMLNGWEERDIVDMRKALLRSIWVGSVQNKDNVIAVARLVGDGIYNVILYDLLVHPDFQGQGLGTRLTQAAHQFVKSMNIDRLECISSVSAEPFYRKIGWEEGHAFYIKGNK